MTLQDLIDFLRDEAQEQTLTEQAITRCVLLAFDLGMAAGEARMSPSAPVIPAEAEVQESPAHPRQDGEHTC